MPAAGKTGTTQNWADAWTSGFTPYYTSTFWFGFDRPGQSLGLNITGATLAGFAWGDYMREIHRDLLAKDFPEPLDGVIKAEVCATSGMIPTPACSGHITTQWYLQGTQPTAICTVHSGTSTAGLSISRLKTELYKSGQHFSEKLDTTPLKLNLDFLPPESRPANLTTTARPTIPSQQQQNATTLDELPDYNYLME